MSGNHMQQVSPSAPTQPLYNVPSLRKVLNARPQGGHFGFCVATTLHRLISCLPAAAVSSPPSVLPGQATGSRFGWFLPYLSVPPVQSS